MWDLKACRCCLATQTKLEKISEILSRLYANVTGLQFKPGDGYPNYFCVECLTHLKKCLAFRRKSRRAYYALQTTMKTNKQITINDIIKVDRKQNNLISSLDNCNSNNIHCFEITCFDDIPTISISAKDFYNQLENNLFSNTAPTLKKYKASNSGDAYNIIDIKSDDFQDIKNEIDDSQMADENNDESNAQDDTNIDPEDVFKDLQDGDLSDHSTIDNEVWEPATIDTTDVKSKKQQKKKVETEIPSICAKARLLDHCELIPQSCDEMKLNLKKRSQDPIYVEAKLKCSICIRVYSSVDNLVNHVQYHNIPGAVVSCNICAIRLRTEEELAIHEAEEHNYVYKCGTCAKESYTFNEFKNHFKTHELTPFRRPVTGKEFSKYYIIVQSTVEEMYNSLKNYQLSNALFQCDTCYLKFRDEEQYKAHLLLHVKPNIKFKYMCDICKIWCKKKHLLEMHMEKMHNYKYTCKICFKVMYTKMEAHRHKLKHNTDGIDPIDYLKCRDCTSQFKYKRRLKIHREVHHFDKEFCHYCIACGESFSSKYSLYKHQLMEYKRIIIASSYVGEIEYMCIHCQVQFMSEEAYNIHIVKHRHPEAKDVPLSCITCRTLYKDETAYENHFKSCSQYPKNCLYCSTTINSPFESASHYRKFHAQLTHYSLGTRASRYTLCEHCGKSIYHSRMVAHQKLHDKDLPICNYCDKHYSDAQDLASHILFKHTTRPYRCSLCTAAYEHRSFARDHILKTHAPVRPFTCSWCPLKFSHLDFMNEHISKIHDAKPIKIKSIKKSKQNFFCTYPHMKVDISQLTKELISKVTYQICDYHDQNTTTLQDYKKFFLTNPPPLDVIYTEPQMRPAKPKKKKRKLNDNEEKETKPTITIINDIKINSDIGDEDVKDGILKEGTIENGVIEEYDVKTQDTFANEIELGGDEELVLDPNTQYDVIEEDGQQYVVVNNKLFKIEME